MPRRTIKSKKFKGSNSSKESCKSCVEIVIKEINKESTTINYFDNFKLFYKELNNSYDIIVFCLYEDSEGVSDYCTNLNLFFIDLNSNDIDYYYSVGFAMNNRNRNNIKDKINGTEIRNKRKDDKTGSVELFNTYDSSDLNLHVNNIKYKVYKNTKEEKIRIKYNNGCYIDINNDGLIINKYEENIFYVDFEFNKNALLDHYFLIKLK